jgi:hypothetical protein
MSERLQPTYFVKHIDNSYSIAEPQPVYVPASETVTWQNMGPVGWSEDPSRVGTPGRLISQLRFIVDQAPMLNVPTGQDALARLNNSVVPYIYMNPKTWESLSEPLFNVGQARPKLVYYRLSFKCPTKFVPLDLIPEGRMLCTSNKIPGVEGL